MQTHHTTKTTRGIASGAAMITMATLMLVAAGAWWLRAGGAPGEMELSADTFEVKRGSFDITVPTSGELAALQKIEVKNQLESRAVIAEIIDEGVRAKVGDVLVRFNDDAIRNNIRDAEDAVEIARNDVVSTTALLEIRQKTRESKIAEAEVNIMLAELALRSWLEGTDKTTRQDFELRVKTAEKEFNRADVRYEASLRLRAQDFYSEDDLSKDEITLLRAESDLAKAKLQQRIYFEIDSVRFQKERTSDHQQAIDEFDREKQRLDTEVHSAESDVRSRERRLESRLERLARWQDQLEKCTIVAPSAGLVVYASSLQSENHGRNNEDPPQVGTDVAPKRTIMILPDISQMVAAVKVNEARSGQIEPGQKTTVVSDALPDHTLTGEVLSVGVLAESGGWRDPNRRDYTVRVLLHGADELGLKPSMRCKATIAVGRVEDALHVPIQAIFRDGPSAYVYSRVPGGWAQKSVQLGRASDLYVEIASGIESGDIVLLREATAAEVVERLDNNAAPDRMARRGGDGNQPPSRDGARRNRRRPGGSGNQPGGAGAHGERQGGGENAAAETHRGGDEAASAHGTSNTESSAAPGT